MRGYILGLLSGLLIMGMAWACGPGTGPGDAGGNDQKTGDTGIKVGALSVKTVEVDCSAPVEMYGGLKGVPVEGVDLSEVVGVLGVVEIPNTKYKNYFSGSLVNDTANNRVMAPCPYENSSFTMRILVK